jgi:hypothetical protein
MTLDDEWNGGDLNAHDIYSGPGNIKEKSLMSIVIYLVSEVE